MKRERLAGGVVLAAAAAAQVTSDFQMLKYFGDFPPVEVIAGVAWLIALAATMGAAVVCLLGFRVLALALAVSALALNVLATGLSATHSVVEGYPLVKTLKIDLFGVYSDGEGFSLSLLFAGIVTLVLLVAGTVVVAMVRDGAPSAAPIPSGGAVWNAAVPPAMRSTPPPPMWQQPAAAPGWYPHPSGNGALGFWNGATWQEVPTPTS